MEVDRAREKRSGVLNQRDNFLTGRRLSRQVIRLRVKIRSHFNEEIYTTPKVIVRQQRYRKMEVKQLEQAYCALQPQSNVKIAQTEGTKR